MDPATQQGAAMAAIGLAGTLAGLFFGWLRDRDKLRYDQEFAALKTQNATQATQIATLTREHAECKEQSRLTESRLLALERAIEQKKDRTDGHVPLA
jgi:hypothetical protein